MTIRNSLLSNHGITCSFLLNPAAMGSGPWARRSRQTVFDAVWIDVDVRRREHEPL